MTAASNDAEALLRPFDTDEREALLDRVMERLDRGPEKASEESPPEAPPVIELSTRRSRSAPMFVLAIAVAAAAALVLWMVMTSPSSRRGPEVASLPEYTFTELRGGIAEKRSGEPVPEEVKLHADDRIEWVVTPAEPVRDAIEVALLAEPDGDGEPRLVPLPSASVSTSGGVRLAGRFADLVVLEPGAWTISVLVAGRGGLPRDVDEAREASERWRAAKVHAIIVAP